MLKAGRMDARLELQRPIRPVDSFGDPSPQAWETIARPWAQVLTERATETLAAARPATERQVVFRVRAPIALEADWRILWNGQAFGIVAHTSPPRAGFVEIVARYHTGATGA